MPTTLNDAFNVSARYVLHALRATVTTLSLSALLLTAGAGALLLLGLVWGTAIPLIYLYRIVMRSPYRFISKISPAKPMVSVQTTVGWLCDAALYPLMLIVSGTLTERPQRTHPWNNEKFPYPRADVLILNGEADKKQVTVVTEPGKAGESPRYRYWFVPMFHLPILGGWKHYVVLRPTLSKEVGEWHVGWLTATNVGVTKVKTKGALRVLVGPDDITFFGLKPDGTQIAIKRIGEGTIGDDGLYRRLPLF